MPFREVARIIVVVNGSDTVAIQVHVGRKLQGLELSECMQYLVGTTRGRVKKQLNKCYIPFRFPGENVGLVTPKCFKKSCQGLHQLFQLRH